MGVISCCHSSSMSLLFIQPAAGAHFSGRGVEWSWQCRPRNQYLQSTACIIAKSSTPRTGMRVVSNQMLSASTYSSRISTDIPLYESTAATFDQYLVDKPRVFKAMFPDKRRSQQLNEEEWKIHMLPLQFGFLAVSPVVDMRLRCKSEGIDYPAGVPCDITKVLELDIIRWDLQGLEIPSQFFLGVEGALYSDRRGARSRLKGQLKITISYVVPPVLALVPEDIRRDIAEKVLKTLVENMKDKVNDSLLADYGKFKKERLLKLA